MWNFIKSFFIVIPEKVVIPKEAIVDTLDFLSRHFGDINSTYGLPKDNRLFWKYYNTVEDIWKDRGYVMPLEVLMIGVRYDYLFKRKTSKYHTRIDKVVDKLFELKKNKENLN